MSHHTHSGSDGSRHEHEHEHEHEHGAERHHRHHHHGQESERRRLGPHVAARTIGPPREIAGYLSELADAIRAGGVTIRSGERAVGLRLNGDVALDLRAAAGDGGTSRLDVSLSWQAPRPPEPPAPKLSISILQAPDPAAQDRPSEERHEPYPGNPPTESIPEGQTFSG